MRVYELVVFGIRESAFPICHVVCTFTSCFTEQHCKNLTSLDIALSAENDTYPPLCEELSIFDVERLK